MADLPLGTYNTIVQQIYFLNIRIMLALHLLYNKNNTKLEESLLLNKILY